MGATATITGRSSGVISLNEKTITDVEFEMRTPEDSNARSTDVTFLLRIKGRIIPELMGTSGEVSTKLSDWSRVTGGEDVYRHVIAQYTGENQVMRNFEFSKAFVQGYEDDFSDTAGTGTFVLELCQKKDHNKEVRVNGGYPL